jgi:antitoxin VapB
MYYKLPRFRDANMIHLSPETIALAQRLAAAQGISIEYAVKQAIERSAHEVGISRAGSGNPRSSADRMMAISERFARYPVLDPRSPDEIIGYDEFGVPN